MRNLHDAAWRVTLWLGYRAARQWWRLTRPDQHGALVAIWLDGKLLAVRQSYRRTLSLPGGGVHRGEAPLAAARRELGEEIGLAVPAERLARAFEVTVEWDYRRDHVIIFELLLDALPALRIDNREIVATCFLLPEDLLAGPVAPHLRAYLMERLNAATASASPRH